jgi:hypothetical protein
MNSSHSSFEEERVSVSTNESDSEGREELWRNIWQNTEGEAAVSLSDKTKVSEILSTLKRIDKNVERILNLLDGPEENS